MDVIKKLQKYIEEIGDSCVMHFAMGLFLFTFGFYVACSDGIAASVPYLVGSSGWMIAAWINAEKRYSDFKLALICNKLSANIDNTEVPVKIPEKGFKRVILADDERIVASYTTTSWNGIKFIMSAPESPALKLVDTIIETETEGNQ